MPIRLLFINAIFHRQIETVTPNLGLGYLSAMLKQRFGKDHFEIRVIDRDIEKTLDSFKPHVVGISSVTQNYSLARKYAKEVKSRGIPVFVGGVHISSIPSSLDPSMDFAVIGEGENTICNIIENFGKHGNFSNPDFFKIPGLLVRRGGKLLNTGPVESIAPLDLLPFPDRDVIPWDPHHASIFSTRGCPYRCVFCFSSHYWGKTRFFSADYVFREVSHLVLERSAKRIHFQDDLFIADKKRFFEIVRRIDEAGLNKKTEFTCTCRANLVDAETASALKKMNVVEVFLGLESGCPRTLDYLKGGSVTVEQNENAVRHLKKAGIDSVIGSFIIGSPTETREEILQTLAFVRKIPLDHCKTFVLTPLPSTPVWEYAKSKGFVSDSMDWDVLRLEFEERPDKAIVISETLSRDEIIGLLKLFSIEERKKRRYYLLRHPALLLERGVAKLKQEAVRRIFSKISVYS